MNCTGKCDICQLNVHKYKCPRCEMKTCSLTCCNKHKIDTNCNGQRDRTKFTIKEELDLLSDYRFLEEQSLLVDTSHRNLVAQDSLVNKSANGFFENLRKFLNNEFNICLRIMPSQSSRHLSNKTKFNRSTKMVSWSMELIFHSDHNDIIKINTKNILFSSKNSLKEGLINFYDKYKNELIESAASNSSLVNPMSLYASFNTYFENNNFQELNILFRIDDYEKKEKYFIELNLNDSLEQLFRDKTIIEYPTLYIVKSNCLHEYLIKKEEKDELNIMTKSMKIDTNNKIKSSDDLEDGECDDDEEEEEDDAQMNNKRSNLNESYLNKKVKIAEDMQ